MMDRGSRILQFVITGFLAGLIYPIFGDDWDRYMAFVNGATIGVIGSASVGLIETYIFDHYWKPSRFLLTAFTKTIMYTLILGTTVVLVKAFNESIYYGESYWSYLKGASFSYFIFKEDFHLILLYSLTIIGLIIIGNMLGHKMGPGVLWNFISGKYHTPKTVSITLMFIDLKSSTVLTEQLGAEGYHKFVNQFHHDIAKCIVSVKGSIYRYVGDQLAIFWHQRDGNEGLHLINLYFNVLNTLGPLKEEYVLRFGHSPEFRACGHRGQLVIGEIGDVKSQIVFHGPALYICDLIEKECKKIGEDFLISADLLNSTNLPKNMIAHNSGTVKYNDTLEIPVFTIRPVEGQKQL